MSPKALALALVTTFAISINAFAVNLGDLSGAWRHKEAVARGNQSQDFVATRTELTTDMGDGTQTPYYTISNGSMLGGMNIVGMSLYKHASDTQYSIQWFRIDANNRLDREYSIIVRNDANVLGLGDDHETTELSSITRLPILK